MKFYIASRLENADTVKKIALALKSWGMTHTYDWTAHGSVQYEGPERISEVAELELQGVREADIIIVLLPGGRGTHCELGMANVLNKKVFLWAETDEMFLQDERTCAFYWNNNVERVVGDNFALLEKIFCYEAKMRLN